MSAVVSSLSLSARLLRCLFEAGLSALRVFVYGLLFFLLQLLQICLFFFAAVSNLFIGVRMPQCLFAVDLRQLSADNYRISRLLRDIAMLYAAYSKLLALRDLFQTIAQQNLLAQLLSTCKRNGAGTLLGAGIWAGTSAAP